MTMQKESPYIAHVFICTNDRAGIRKSCADNNSQLIKDRLKESVNTRGWKGKVRVSTSGCLGLCDNGPNVIIYPQKIHFCEVNPDALGEIIAAIEQIMDADRE